MKERETFGSRLGFILVSAGCAIGLGNVWKFPYMAGKYGGAAFILIYLIFLVLLGLPVLVCEFAVGRASRKSTARAFHDLEPEGANFHNFSYMSMVSNYVLMMFYTMVAGWMLYYCYAMAAGKLDGKDSAQVADYFTGLQDSAGTMTLWMIIVVVLSFGVCSLGVQRGLEKITKVMMICLLALIVVLAVHSLTLDGAMEGVKFYLVPDFAAMAEIGIGNVIFGALSQAFFTLSIGAGSMTIFGSYLGKDRSLLGESLHITILDTFVALMAGLIIIPACFAFGVEPGAGPGLVFITLPNVFNQMTGGKIWGALFFLFMSFASLSTVIAVFENIISYSMDRKGWSRGKAVIVNMVAMILLSLPAVFGFNILSGIQPLGAGTNIMDLEDFIVSNNILPLGSVVFVMFCVSKYGWGWKRFIKEADTGEGLKFPANVQKYMLYVISAIVVVIYLKGYYDMFSPKGPVVLTVWMLVSLLVLGLVGWIIFGKNKTK
ncbi:MULTISPECIES: sodium-dependent transporter [unclassified Ruminococcus]|uniref:sodium-dependent transporter n=1 Tax=unclassified Ruminococcus TaxID=2608920 RepID=UPI0018AB5D63|nr:MULTISPECIES: sodium-dependent transporter [unclassified Ruminococcus]MDB8777398.1 sodium-dependent transporter [Ruminococcus sp. 1001136sp1]